MSAEDKVFNLLQQHNKPFNTQAVADLLATQGIKKAAAQKTLDALAEAGRIVVKEFGKIKIYFAVQQGLAVLSKEESDAKKEQVKQLQQEVQQEAQAAKELEAELNELKSSLTEEQIDSTTADLTVQLSELNKRLAVAKSGAVVMTKEQRMQLEKKLSAALEQWRKRRSVFREIWDTISESLERKQAELFEEMGVETDAAVVAAGGVEFSQVEQLLSKRRRLR